MQLHLIDYLILGAYFATVLLIGWALKRTTRTGLDFFLSGRSLPTWITALAFISANLGAQEVIGMAASGAKYGILTSHFYWVGAIPAMVFLGLFMMPFYYGSKVRSVPEYLRLRFDEKTRTLNALSFAAMTLFSSGISMYVLGRLFELFLGWDINLSILASAGIVLVYVFLGGLTSSIYNEVIQFFLIVFGTLPLAVLGLMGAGGWDGLKERLATVAVERGLPPDAWTSSWRHLGAPADNPMGVEWFGLVMGLGVVLSFGYWCTDFLVVQRAMAAGSVNAARNTPIVAALPKMLFPFLVILPGMAAVALLPPEAFVFQGQTDYNMALPLMLERFYPPGLLGLGLTALLASFMSGMAGNVTAFNTVWTYDIYQTYLRPRAPDAHYLWVGRLTTVFGTLASIGTAYIAMAFGNIMDLLQLVFAFINAPLFATFLLGMFWVRTTPDGAFWGLVAGTLAAAGHYLLTGVEGLSAAAAVGIEMTAAGGAAAGIGGGVVSGLQAAAEGTGTPPVLHVYASEMAQNFWGAIVAWATCMAATVGISRITRPRDPRELVGLVYGLTPKSRGKELPWHRRPAPLAAGILAVTLLLNLIFW